MSVNPVVKKETGHIAVGTVALSAVMVGIFVACGRFDWTVLWGALLGTGYAILNFFLMAYTIQKGTESTHEQAKTKVQLSYILRTLLMLAVGILGMALPCFYWMAVLLPFFFPRLTIHLMHLFKIADPSADNTEDQTKQEGSEEVKK